MGAAKAILTFLAATAAEPAAAPVLPPLPPAAQDGYVFERRSHRLDQVTVTIIRYPTFAALHKARTGRDKPFDNGKQVVGYATWEGSKCTIHIVDEAVHYRPEIAGHELIHCIAGDFHPTQPR